MCQVQAVAIASGVLMSWCRWWYFAIAIISAILFTAFLIYDLQLLMGGGARELSPDEYIFAAVNIYLVRICLHEVAPRMIAD